MTSLQWYKPNSMESAWKVAQYLAKSRLLPDSLKTAEDVFSALMLGAELGLDAMQSLRSIHVINGKPCLSADMMVGLVKRSASCEWFRLLESTNTLARYETKRQGEPEPTSMAFTFEDAKRASLTNKQVWRQFPAAMLRARCATALARAVYPDVIGGIYDSEELGEDNPARHVSEPEDSNIIDIEPEPAPKQIAPSVPEWREEAARKYLSRESFKDLPEVGEKWAANLHGLFGIESGAGAYDKLHNVIAEGEPAPKGLGARKWLAIYNALRELKHLQPVEELPERALEPIPEDPDEHDDGGALVAEIETLDDVRVLACNPEWWQGMFSRIEPNGDPHTYAKACLVHVADVLVDVLQLEHAKKQAGNRLLLRIQAALEGSDQAFRPGLVAQVAGLYVGECLERAQSESGGVA